MRWRRRDVSGRRRLWHRVAVADAVVSERRDRARACATCVCVGPKAAAAGFHEPSLVFMTGTSTLLTDGSGAADFLGQGSCRFALVEARSERGFVQRAEAIGLRYNVATRIDGYNILAGQGDLDRDLPLRRHGVGCPRRPAAADRRMYLSHAGRMAADVGWPDWCGRRRIRAVPRRRAGCALHSRADRWARGGVVIVALMCSVDAARNRR